MARPTPGDEEISSRHHSDADSLLTACTSDNGYSNHDSDEHAKDCPVVRGGYQGKTRAAGHLELIYLTNAYKCCR